MPEISLKREINIIPDKFLLLSRLKELIKLFPDIADFIKIRLFIRQ